MIIIFLCFFNLLEFSTLIKYASFTINKLKDITQDVTKDVTQDIKILGGRSQDGGGIGRGDHFLFYKFIERTTER